MFLNLKGHSFDPSIEWNSDKELVDKESPPTTEAHFHGSIASEVNLVVVYRGEGRNENDVHAGQSVAECGR